LSGQILTESTGHEILPPRNNLGEAPMSGPERPAYLLVTAKVADRAKMAAYTEALAASGLYAKHGGRYLFVGPAANPVEDWPQGQSAVLAIFPSRAAAEAFWFSDAYQNDIKPLRDGAGEFHVAIFEGLAS
jgi:uncharacterized protein (DUF1330 family)